MTLGDNLEAQPRPLLHHLNADSSWLLQLPDPNKTQTTRNYYNILIDPWLQGPQSDVASWFSRQWHAIPSKFQTIHEVSDLALQAESLECRKSGQSAIDVIVVSHEFTDHCHKGTLLEVLPGVPVFAPDKAAALIRGWSHFDVVIETPVFSEMTKDWRALKRGARMEESVLPEWVRIGRVQELNNALYYHSAVVVMFEIAKKPLSTRTHLSYRKTTSGNTNARLKAQDVDSDTTTVHLGTRSSLKGESGAGSQTEDLMTECVVYTPHGIAPSALVSPFTASISKIQTLCLLHGLHDISLPPVQQLNLGAHNGLQVQRALKPKYWVTTHDEVKTGGGLVSWFLKRKMLNLQDAVDKEKLDMDLTVSDDTVVHVKDVGNGETLILS